MTESAFTRNDQGLFELAGTATPDAIIQQAETLLRENIQSGQALSSPRSAADFLKMSLANEKNEHFAALFLNTRHVVIHYEKLFHGTIDGASVYPRVVVQKALEHNAAAVIFAHNHPSGDCEPSRSDKRITKDLVDALDLINVRVLDHFVVSQSGYVSLAEQGWL